MEGEEKKLSEIRELSYANYGRIVARLTPIRGGTRFALSVSPHCDLDPSVCRVLHIKGFSFSFFFRPSRSSRQTDRSAVIQSRYRDTTTLIDV